jgi:hypothetical protein
VTAPLAGLNTSCVREALPAAGSPLIQWGMFEMRMKNLRVSPQYPQNARQQANESRPIGLRTQQKMHVVFQPAPA